MLRRAVLAIAVLIVALAMLGVLADAHDWPLLLLAVAVLAGVLFERRHYGAARDSAPIGPDWAATDERFIDETGKEVRVWYNAATGERRYVGEKLNHRIMRY